MISPLVVFGCGGHGKVVADAAQRAGFQVLGFLDDHARQGTRVLGLEVLGGGSWLAQRPGHAVALGVGNNDSREVLAGRLRDEFGVVFPAIVHQAAHVASSAELGEGVVVCAGAVVNPDARVRRGAILNSSCVVEHDVEVSEFAHVSPKAALAGGAALGERAHLGLGASVLPSIVVGSDTWVGAGAVVVRDLPPGVVAVGVPARVIRSRSEPLEG